MTSGNKAARRPQRARTARAMVATTGALVALALFGTATDARADCALVATAARQLQSTLGSAAQPYGSPGRLVSVFAPVQCVPEAPNLGFNETAALNQVQITFLPLNGGPSPAPIVVDPTAPPADPSRPGTIIPEECFGTTAANTRCTTLRFEWPDTAGEPGGPFVGPARVEIRNLGTGQLIAQIDELFEPTVSCNDTNRVATQFLHFSGLPSDNLFTPGPNETLLAGFDGGGNLLFPVDWSPALALATTPDRAGYRIVSAKNTVFGALLGPGDVQAFTIETGQPLPPIIEINDAGDTVTGSIDFPFSVVRIARPIANSASTVPIPFPLALAASAAGPLNSVSPSEQIVGIARDETLEGQFLNADADTDDRAASFIDKPSGLVVDTGLAVMERRASPLKAILEARDDVMAFCQSEAHEGTPINAGDPDAVDCIARFVRSDAPGFSDLGGTPLVTADPAGGIDGTQVFSIIGSAPNNYAVFLRNEKDEAPEDVVHASPDQNGQFASAGSSTAPSLSGDAVSFQSTANLTQAQGPSGATVVWETADIPSKEIDFPFILVNRFAFREGEEQVAGVDLFDCTADVDGFQISLLQGDEFSGTFTADLFTVPVLPAPCFSAVVGSGAGAYQVFPPLGADPEDPDYPFVVGTIIQAEGDPLDVSNPDPVLPPGYTGTRIAITLNVVSVSPVTVQGEFSLLADAPGSVGGTQIYRHALDTGATTLVSRNDLGVAADADAVEPSAAGPLTSFASAASNLDPADTDLYSDVFVHDSTADTTEVVSVDTGVVGNCDQPSMAGDGSAVAFRCAGDVFLRDLLTDTTIRVTTDDGSGASFEPSVGGGGWCVAFASDNANLIPGEPDLNGHSDVYWWDRASGAIRRVTRGLGGAPTNGDSSHPSASEDCRYVALSSSATNLVGSSVVLNNPTQCYVVDTLKDDAQIASLTLAGQGSDGACLEPDISRDGRYVGFLATASNLGGGAALLPRSYRADRLTGIVAEVSLASDGSPTAASSAGGPSLDADGRSLALASAGALDPADPNGEDDVYVRELVPGIDLDGNGQDDDRLLYALGGGSAPIASGISVKSVATGGGLAAFRAEGGDPGALFAADEVGLFDPSGPTVQPLGVVASEVAMSDLVLCVVSTTGALLVGDPAALLAGAGALTPVGAQAERVQAVDDKCVFLDPGTTELGYYDPAATPAVVATGRVALDFQVASRGVAFRRPEGADGNGDNDFADAGEVGIMEFWDFLAHSDTDPATVPLIPTLSTARRCLFPGCDPFFEPYRVISNILSFVALESDEENAFGTLEIGDACLPGAAPGVCDLTGEGLGGSYAVKIFNLDAREAQIIPISQQQANQVAAAPFADGDGKVTLSLTEEGTAITGDCDGDGVLCSDGITNPAFSNPDNCQGIQNPDQTDADRDKLGAACDLAAGDANSQDNPGNSICDLDKENGIDANDVGRIFNDVGTQLTFFDQFLGVFPDDRNPDGNSVVSVLDAGQCLVLCEANPSQNPAACQAAASASWTPPAEETGGGSRCGLLGIEVVLVMVLRSLRRRGRRRAATGS